MTDLLRRARVDDLDPLLELNRSFYAEAGYAWDAAAAEGALKQLIEGAGLGRLWLITGEVGVVGYVAVTFGFSIEFAGRDAFVDELFVREAFRGQGWANRALEAAEAECVALGVCALHLEVEHDNDPALSLYDKRGYALRDRKLLTKHL